MYLELSIDQITRDQAGSIYPTLLTPRPVVMIGTADASGRCNLAPFSSISFVANNPPMIVASISKRKGEIKDTLRNIEASGELVVNLLTRSMAGAALNAAKTADEGDPADDYARAGLSRADFGEFVVGRIVTSPAALGCKLLAVHALEPSSASLVVCEVKRLCVSDEWRSCDDKAPQALDLFASIAAEQYIGLGDASPFFLPRTWD